jgi:hypothetical protein
MEQYLPCLYAFLACAGFCIVFEIRKPLFILLSCVTGAVGWLVFLLLAGIGSDVVRYLLATIVVSVLSEIFARILKAPATIFLVIGIVPLVPGGGLYYAMDALINGDYALFAQKGIETAACAGAIAAGVSVVTSIARMVASQRMGARRKDG